MVGERLLNNLIQNNKLLGIYWCWYLVNEDKSVLVPTNNSKYSLASAGIWKCLSIPFQNFPLLYDFLGYNVIAFYGVCWISSENFYTSYCWMGISEIN